jgi:molybdopterin-binding protein
MLRNAKSAPKIEVLLHLPDAASQLGISIPTIKQWIYKDKIRSIKTTGGHHRIPQSELDRLLFKTRGKTEKERSQQKHRVSGRNQLVGRIDSLQISGLMAEAVLSVGSQQITSIITARSAREMELRPGQTVAALIKSTEVMILRL